MTNSFLLTLKFTSIPCQLVVSTATAKNVTRVNPHLHRNQVLLLLGLHDYCRYVGDRCVMHKNHQPWHVEDGTVHNINHGDYVRIQVPPPDDPSLDTEVAIQITRAAGVHELPPRADPGHLCSPSLALFQHTVEILRHAGQQLAIATCKSDPAEGDFSGVDFGPRRPGATSSTPSGVAAVEHPQEPEEPQLASIWKLPLCRALRDLPGVELLPSARAYWLLPRVSLPACYA